MSHARGQSHFRATLSDVQVREMRATYTTWKEEGKHKGYEALAKVFGCGVSTARDIVTYRTRIDA